MNDGRIRGREDSFQSEDGAGIFMPRALHSVAFCYFQSAADFLRLATLIRLRSGLTISTPADVEFQSAFS